jgi:hypothetical protein
VCGERRRLRDPAHTRRRAHAASAAPVAFSWPQLCMRACATHAHKAGSLAQHLLRSADLCIEWSACWHAARCITCARFCACLFV